MNRAHECSVAQTLDRLVGESETGGRTDTRSGARHACSRPFLIAAAFTLHWPQRRGYRPRRSASCRLPRAGTPTSSRIFAGNGGTGAWLIGENRPGAAGLSRPKPGARPGRRLCPIVDGCSARAGMVYAFGMTDRAAVDPSKDFTPFGRRMPTWRGGHRPRLCEFVRRNWAHETQKNPAHTYPSPACGSSPHLQRAVRLRPARRDDVPYKELMPDLRRADVVFRRSRWRAGGYKSGKLKGLGGGALRKRMAALPMCDFRGGGIARCCLQRGSASTSCGTHARGSAAQPALNQA